MTPSCTSGVAVFGPGGNASDHASCSSATLFLSICVSGEKPSPSCVRRQVSQSFGDGFASISSVTSVAGDSAFGALRPARQLDAGGQRAAGALSAQALLLGELWGRRARRLAPAPALCAAAAATTSANATPGERRRRRTTFAFSRRTSSFDSRSTHVYTHPFGGDRQAAGRFTTRLGELPIVNAAVSRKRATPASRRAACCAQSSGSRDRRAACALEEVSAASARRSRRR